MCRFTLSLHYALIAVVLLQMTVAVFASPTPSSSSIPSPPPVGSDDWVPASEGKPVDGEDDVQSVSRYTLNGDDTAPVKIVEHHVVEETSKDNAAGHQLSKTSVDTVGGSVVRVDLKTSTRISYGRFRFSAMTKKLCVTLPSPILFARYAPYPGYSASCVRKVGYYRSRLCVSPVCRCTVEYWRA